ncbi:MAG TPA: FMN-binding protein [Burkholderiales bacterium]|nr:FMN-binding protein [Burkholderiales bacterium]
MPLQARDRFGLLAAALALSAAGVIHAEIYQAPGAFVAEVFGSNIAPKVLWLTRPIQAEATAILDHPPAQLRQRYWSDGRKSVWILEETGKEELITAGFVVSDGRIDHVRVLVYRESRGGEVRRPSFLKQFHDARLAPGNRLDRDIDGIVGATLSVGAMERMARLALYFDRKSREE